MLAVIRGWISKYETYAWISIIVIMMTVSWRAHSILDRANRTSELQAALDAQHETDKKQFEHDLAEGLRQAKIDQKNNDSINKVNDDIKNHPTQCPLPLSRVQLINDAASRK